VSPILVRPVREQLEHDRIIRLLQVKFRRRFDVGINPGAEQNSAVNSAGSVLYPDVVLLSQDRGRRVMAVIEVETVESVNNLEALAQWVPFGRLKSAFHLYVPAQMLDVARRLCTDSNIPVAEIHSYHWIGDEMRFLPVYKAPNDGKASPVKPAARPVAARPASKPAPSSGRTAGAKKTKAATKKVRKPARKTSRPSKRK
jgi:hypothetical protein